MNPGLRKRQGAKNKEEKRTLELEAKETNERRAKAFEEDWKMKSKAEEMDQAICKPK